MKKGCELWIDVIGWFLIAITIFRLVMILAIDDPVHIFWLCNHVPLIMGIAILFRNSFWLIAEFCILSVGSFNWNLDYYWHWITGNYLIGGTEYLSLINPYFAGFSIVFHGLSLPLSLIAIFLIGKKSFDVWKGTLVHALGLVIPAWIFRENYNLNCYINSCLESFSWVPYYSIFIFVGYMVVVVVPLSYVLNWLVERFNKP